MKVLARMGLTIAIVMASTPVLAQTAADAKFCAQGKWELKDATAASRGVVVMPGAWGTTLKRLARCTLVTEAGRGCLMVEGRFNEKPTAAQIAQLGATDMADAQLKLAKARGALVAKRLLEVGAPQERVKEIEPHPGATFRGAEIFWNPACLPVVDPERVKLENEAAAAREAAEKARQEAEAAKAAAAQARSDSERAAAEKAEAAAAHAKAQAELEEHRAVQKAAEEKARHEAEIAAAVDKAKKEAALEVERAKQEAAQALDAERRRAAEAEARAVEAQRLKAADAEAKKHADETDAKRKSDEAEAKRKAEEAEAKKKAETSAQLDKALTATPSTGAVDEEPVARREDGFVFDFGLALEAQKPSASVDPAWRTRASFGVFKSWEYALIRGGIDYSTPRLESGFGQVDIKTMLGLRPWKFLDFGLLIGWTVPEGDTLNDVWAGFEVTERLFMFGEMSSLSLRQAWIPFQGRQGITHVTDANWFDIGVAVQLGMF